MAIAAHDAHGAVNKVDGVPGFINGIGISNAD